MIEVTRDLKDIVCCSLRYALGRRTYITSLISGYVMEHPELIDERVKGIMLKDIEEYLECRNIYYKDDECDYQSWLKLKNWLEEDNMKEYNLNIKIDNIKVDERYYSFDYIVNLKEQEIKGNYENDYCNGMTKEEWKKYLEKSDFCLRTILEDVAYDLGE